MHPQLNGQSFSMQCTAGRVWQSLRASVRVHSSSSSRLRSCFVPRQSQLASTSSSSKNTAKFQCQAYGSQSVKVQTRASSSIHSLQQQRHALPPSSSSSRAYVTCAANIAAAQAPVKTRAHPLLTSEAQQRVQADRNKLDDNQLAVVVSEAQHRRVKAGPGSGKTRAIVARVAHLICERYVDPRAILVVTFTNKATAELATRMAQLMGPEVAANLVPVTFHKLCLQLLRKYAMHPNQDVSIATEDERKEVVRTILEQDRFSKARAAFKDRVAKYCESINYLKSFSVNIRGRPGQQLIEEIEALKKQKIDVPQLSAVYDEYVRVMDQSGRLDYDDVLHHTVDMLHRKPELLSVLQEHWKDLLVDECQDTNPCQWELLKLLAGAYTRVFVVGDPRQAIYICMSTSRGADACMWRGADPRGLTEEFVQLFPKAKTYDLRRNYRSRDCIVKVAERIPQPDRLPPTPWPEGQSMKPNEDNKTHVKFLKARDERHEANLVLTEIKHALASQGPDGDVCSVAVLARRWSDLELVKRELSEAGIPFTEGSKVFWDRLEIKAAVMLLRLLVDPLHAGDSLLSCRRTSFKVPLLEGLLGEKGLRTLKLHLYKHHGEATLGGCLFGDLPMVLSVEAQQRIIGSRQRCGLPQLLSRIQHGSNSAADQQQQQQVFDWLSGLAPSWERPAKLKKNQQQVSAVNRLRGLVMLGRAMAESGSSPGKVLKALLVASGIWGKLQKQLKSDDSAGRKEAYKQLKNLQKLVVLGGDESMYAAPSPHLHLPELDGQDEYGIRRGQGDFEAYEIGADQMLTKLNKLSKGMHRLWRFYRHCADEGDVQLSQGNEVQLLTMHESKGKEFDVVIAVRMHDGSVPSSHRKDGFLSEDDHRQSEGNLAFVTASRARELCVYIWCVQLMRYSSNFNHNGEPSNLIKSQTEDALAGCIPGAITVL